MGYLSSSVNSSATIAATVGAACEQPAMRAFFFDGNGALVLATAGVHAVGIAVADTGDLLEKGDSLTVQVKDICPALTGGAFAKGAELSCAADGRLVTANTGAFILATALEASGGAGEVALVQIVKAGYK